MALDDREREVVEVVFTAAWHSLKSYEYGNSATDLAKEACAAIVDGAIKLGITIKGYETMNRLAEATQHRENV